MKTGVRSVAKPTGQSYSQLFCQSFPSPYLFRICSWTERAGARHYPGHARKNQLRKGSATGNQAILQIEAALSLDRENVGRQGLDPFMRIAHVARPGDFRN